MEIHVTERDVVCDHLYHSKKFFVTNREHQALLSSLYVHLTQCIELLSKHPEANFKYLLGMELATDVILLFLSSVTNDIFVYFSYYRCGL